MVAIRKIHQSYRGPIVLSIVSLPLLGACSTLKNQIYRLALSVRTGRAFWVECLRLGEKQRNIGATARLSGVVVPDCRLSSIRLVRNTTSKEYFVGVTQSTFSKRYGRKTRKISQWYWLVVHSWRAQPVGQCKAKTCNP